jgi:hypothetical protein
MRRARTGYPDNPEHDGVVQGRGMDPYQDLVLFRDRSWHVRDPQPAQSVSRLQYRFHAVEAALSFEREPEDEALRFFCSGQLS